MSTLYLPVQRRWFEDIKAGIKPEEYREVTPFWIKRLTGKTFDKIVVTLGYPSKSNKDRRLEFPWRGYTVKSIVHPHFGDRKLSVFAIKLERP